LLASTYILIADATPVVRLTNRNAWAEPLPPAAVLDPIFRIPNMNVP
jgi:hypothetical protein